MKKEDIRKEGYYDVLLYMLEHDRSEWKSILSEYITKVDPTTKWIQVNNSISNLCPIECFSENYQGKYNLGDYVTTLSKGGYYRIVGLPYLDIRWKEQYNQWDEDPEVNIARIEQFGFSYTLAGVDDNNQASGTEYYLYFEDKSDYGVDLLLGDCFESNLKSIEPTAPLKEFIDSKAQDIFIFLDEKAPG